MCYSEERGIYFHGRLFLISLYIFLAIVNSATAQEKKKVSNTFQGELEADLRYYINEGLYSGQERYYFSASATPEYLLEWKDRQHSIKLVLFGRLDQWDQNRTHWDVREFYYQTYKKDWELTIGAKKIFWGVIESVHLVDIINQTDVVESFDGEQKLGQPMVHYSQYTKIGTFDFFGMTYFRKRQFPGEKGRLRTPFIIDKDAITFESDLEEWQPEGAFRWSHYVGAFDMGLSYFYGTGREPILVGLGSPNPLDIMPIYPIIHQAGADLQATTGSVLWKGEAIYRYADVQDMIASAVGFEYSIRNIKSSGIDIGLLAEYLFDNRDELALSGMDNDMFGGIRLAFNDKQSTEILSGGIFDLKKSTKLFFVEASRRLGDSWKLTLEGRFFVTVSQQEFSYFIRDDSFLQLSISKFY